jgi:uridylate kinase
VGDAEYKRVLLKVSGETLMGEEKYGHNVETLQRLVTDIQEVRQTGTEMCIVVGGGNIYRGNSAYKLGIDRAAGDHIGMLATVMNALILQNVIEKAGLDTRVLSAIPMTTICEPYIKRRAIRHMQKGRVVIFAAGTGNPFFTTDSAAVLRAIEMHCDLLLKGTKVDGVYSSDPYTDPEAKRFKEITYTEVLHKNLNVMDLAAIALAKENNLPIKIFSIKEKGNLAKVINSEGKYTKIQGV